MGIQISLDKQRQKIFSPLQQSGKSGDVNYSPNIESDSLGVLVLLEDFVFQF